MLKVFSNYIVQQFTTLSESYRRKITDSKIVDNPHQQIFVIIINPKNYQDVKNFKFQFDENFEELFHNCTKCPGMILFKPKNSASEIHLKIFKSENLFCCNFKITPVDLNKAKLNGSVYAVSKQFSIYFKVHPIFDKIQKPLNGYVKKLYYSDKNYKFYCFLEKREDSNFRVQIAFNKKTSKGLKYYYVTDTFRKTFVYVMLNKKNNLNSVFNMLPIKIWFKIFDFY